MSNIDIILRKLLRETARQKEYTDLRETAQWLVYEHDWEEVTGVRQPFLTQLQNLLRDGEFELDELHEVVKGQTLIGGHYSVHSQVANFLEKDEARNLIKDLIGNGKQPPDAETINRFVDRAVELAFHTQKGVRSASNAAKLASILLSAIYPDQFVDFVHKHWQWAAEHLEIGEIPSGAYGKRLIWAGQAAQQIAHTPTFKRYFSTDIPANWIIGGLVHLFATHSTWQDRVEQVHSAQVIYGGEAMSMSAEQIWDILRYHNPQVILQGPPGSGKTYLAEKVIELLAGPELVKTCRLGKCEEEANAPLLWDVVQFHPSYGYEDFVRGMMTEATEQGIIFRVQDRILAQAAKAAERNPDIPVILILDEINRADLARVLGELIYALERERRGSPISTQYAVDEPSGRTLIFPPNLYLIGTMNTADRSIALVDYAIRRRFSFLSILPHIEVVEAFYEAPIQHEGDQEIATRLGRRVTKLYRAVHALFDDLTDADDIRIGHSYFLVKGIRDGATLSLLDWADAVAFRFAFEVLPMLWEYRKERRLPEGSETIEVGDRTFSLLLNKQNETWAAVREWLAQE